MTDEQRAAELVAEMRAVKPAVEYKYDPISGTMKYYGTNAPNGWVGDGPVETPPSPEKVKPLEWAEQPSFPAESCWLSKTPLCSYTIDQDFGSDAFYYEVRRSGSLVGTCDGLPEAKEAAQADYSSRILSALNAEYVTTLDAAVARAEALQDEIYEINGIWPDWAEKSLKMVREVSGYDGYDDKYDGVDLPAELEEVISDLQLEVGDANDKASVAEKALELAQGTAARYREACNAAGVCMSCIDGAPESFGCWDCQNTGWSGGNPHDRALSAEKERDALREALTPFADLAGEFSDKDHSSNRADDRNVWGYNNCNLTYGDFRRARAALNGRA